MSAITIIAFLLASTCTVFGLAAFVRAAWISIQHGQWADTLFHWQAKLDKWDAEGRTFLFKAGGGCTMCFSFWLSLLLMPLYVLVMLKGFRFSFRPSGFGSWVGSFGLFQVVLFSLAYLSHMLIIGRKTV